MGRGGGAVSKAWLLTLSAPLWNLYLNHLYLIFFYCHNFTWFVCFHKPLFFPLDQWICIIAVTHLFTNTCSLPLIFFMAFYISQLYTFVLKVLNLILLNSFVDLNFRAVRSHRWASQMFKSTSSSVFLLILFIPEGFHFYYFSFLLLAI